MDYAVDINIGHGGKNDIEQYQEKKKKKHFSNVEANVIKEKNKMKYFLKQK